MSPTWSTISTTQTQLKSSSRSNPATRCPRTCMTRSSLTRPSAMRSLHHCSIQEREEPAGRRQAYLLKKVCCQDSPCLSVCRVSTGRPVNELSSLSSCSREKTKSRKGRIAEQSRVKGQGTFKKKIGWRLPRSNFILPGLECQDNLHPWWQRREVPRC